MPFTLGSQDELQAHGVERREWNAVCPLKVPLPECPKLPGDGEFSEL